MNDQNKLHKYISNFLDSNIPDNLIDENKIIRRSSPGLSVYKKFDPRDFSKLRRHKQEIIELVSNNFETEEEGLQKLLQNGESKLKESLFKYLTLREVRPCCSRYPGIWPFCRSDC